MDYSVHPDDMTPTERFGEIASILASTSRVFTTNSRLDVRNTSRIASRNDSRVSLALHQFNYRLFSPLLML